MVWSYHSVKELKEEFKAGEEITVEEKRKLEKYIKRKKKVPCTKEWSQTQLLKAEKLLHDIKQRQEKEPVKAEVTQ